MTISNQQIDALLKMLALTRDREVTCDDCLGQMAEFAENFLTGRSVPESLRCIDEHLQLCGECREEFEALKKAIADETTLQ